MNRISLTTALSLGLASLSITAHAQESATPPAAVTPTPAVSGFTAPEGYAILPDWKEVTADQLKGAEVYHSADGAKVGDISDIALSAEGGVNGVIIDVGGFLGIGVHTVSLGADQISLYAKDGDVIAATTLDKEALKALPEYQAPAQ